MLRVKNMIGEMRSETRDPVVRYAAKRASTNRVVSTAGGGSNIVECEESKWVPTDSRERVTAKPQSRKDQ
jgi:hypothetical protein